LFLGSIPALASDLPIDALSDWTYHNNAGHMAERRGNLPRAAQAFRIAIEAIRPHQADYPALMTRSNADYARVLVAMGRHAEAEPLARWVLASRRASPRASQIEIGRDLNVLALIVKKLGRSAEAESLLREALGKLERAAGPDRADLLVTLETLGALASQRGEDAKAVTFYRRALVVRESTSADGLKLAEAAEFSASVLRLSNRIVEAETYESQATAIRESSAESLGAAVATENLATVLRKTGRDDEAEDLVARAKALRDRIATEAARARETGPLIGVGRSR
ncbi:MAG: tetratricopeptide repeat protein, partial [Isosphaeraceae bacterium]